MPQRLEEGKSSYQGRSWSRFALQTKKSAEVIVVTGNEPTRIVGGLTEVMKD